jgi:hypothetical protein
LDTLASLLRLGKGQSCVTRGLIQRSLGRGLSFRATINCPTTFMLNCANRRTYTSRIFTAITSTKNGFPPTLT